MKISHFFLMLLLPALALGDEPRSVKIAGPKMGPEIEFRGKKLIPSMVCQVGEYASGGLVLAGVAGGALWASTSDEPELSQLALPSLVGGVAGAITFVGCGVIAFKDGATADSYLKKIHENLQPRVRSGELTTNWSSDSSWRSLELEYQDGRKVVFGKDPTVVEVTLPPIRPGELAANLDFYEKEIFEAARAVGLKTPRFDGPWNGGHLHIDFAEAFDSDPAKFKNFLLDFIEHPELADGLLVKDFYNAPVLNPEKQKAALEEVFKLLDVWIEKGEKMVTNRHLAMLAGVGPFSKRDALNLNTFYGTLEIRSLRSQKSAADLLRVMRLFEARIKYTNSLPVKRPRPVKLSLSRAEKGKAFRAYVEESGLDYGEFKQMAPRRYRQDCGGSFSRLLGF